MDQERAKEIVKSIFAEKLKQKEEEVELISERIKEVQKALQLVRYGAVTTISNQTQIYVSFHQIDSKNYKFLIFHRDLKAKTFSLQYIQLPPF